MRNIHIIMTRDDGSEEGNQWDFDGDNEQLYDVFSNLCDILVVCPLVVKPEKKLFEFVFHLPVLLWASQSQIAECRQLAQQNHCSTREELRRLAERAVREYINDGSLDRGDGNAPFAIEVENTE